MSCAPARKGIRLSDLSHPSPVRNLRLNEVGRHLFHTRLATAATSSIWNMSEWKRVCSGLVFAQKVICWSPVLSEILLPLRLAVICSFGPAVPADAIADHRTMASAHRTGKILRVHFPSAESAQPCHQRAIREKVWRMRQDSPLTQTAPDKTSSPSPAG